MKNKKQVGLGEWEDMKAAQPQPILQNPSVYDAGPIVQCCEQTGPFADAPIVTALSKYSDNVMQVD